MVLKYSTSSFFLFFFSFFPHLLFVKLHLCLFLPLNGPPFFSLILLLCFGIYLVLTSVTATYPNSVHTIFPRSGSLRCSRGGRQRAPLWGQTFITDCIANKHRKGRCLCAGEDKWGQNAYGSVETFSRVLNAAHTHTRTCVDTHIHVQLQSYL